MALCALLRGDVHFNHWSETAGESLAERRSVFSLLGVAAHPSDAQQLARITADDVAALACASAADVQAAAAPAVGIHKLERWRLIKSMKQHPLFQDLSFADMYRLSYFFYKVQLEQGDVLGKEGLYPSFVYFVADGSVRRQEQEKRAWKKTERTMRQGSFPGLASFVSNTPCDATYTVNEDHTTIYVCNPSVLLYFVGGRFLGMPQLLEQLRDPTADATLSFLKETVEGLRFYNTGDSVNRMREAFSAIQQGKEPLGVVDASLEERVHALVELLQHVNREPEKEKEQDSHKEGISYAASVGVKVLQTLQLPWIVNSLYSAIAPLFTSEEGETRDAAESAEGKDAGEESVPNADGSAQSPKKDMPTEAVNGVTGEDIKEVTSEFTSKVTNEPTGEATKEPAKETTQEIKPLLDEEKMNASLEHFLQRNDLNDYTDEQLLTTLESFRYASPEASARYLLFLLLSGVSEPCTLTRDVVEEQGRFAGIITDDNKNQILDFFFPSKNTIDLEEFIRLLESSTVPAAVQSYLTTLSNLVARVVPNQKEDHIAQQQKLKTHRSNETDAILRLHSPFHLLPLPMPVPYMMTFSLLPESYSADYRQYIIGSFLGEVFVGIGPLTEL